MNDLAETKECGLCGMERPVTVPHRPIECIATLRAEVERLRDAWFCDDGIAPDGSVRPMLIKTLRRADDAETAVMHLLECEPKDQDHAYCDRTGAECNWCFARRMLGTPRVSCP